MNKLSKIVSGLTIATLTHVASMEATNFRVQFSDELKKVIRETIDAKIPEWENSVSPHIDCLQKRNEYISFFKRVGRVLEERLQARVKNLNIDFHTCAKIADPSFEYKEFQNKDFEKDEFTHKYTLLYLTTRCSKEKRMQAYKYLVNDLQETMETFLETQESSFKSAFPYVLWFFDPDLGVKRVIHTAIMNSCIKPLAKKIIYEYRTMYSFYKKVLEKNIPEAAVSFAYAECLYGEYRKLFLKKINDENKEEFKSHNRRVETLETRATLTTFMELSGYREVVKEKVFKEIMQFSKVIEDNNETAYLRTNWVKEF